MKVDGINPLDGIKKAEDRIESGVRSAPQSGSEEAPEGDVVEVSSDGTMARFTEEINNIPDVRTEQVEALQSAIAQGSYDVPAEDIAAVIIEELV